MRFEAGDAPPPFSTATADTLDAVGPGLEGKPLIMGRTVWDTLLEVP